MASWSAAEASKSTSMSTHGYLGLQLKLLKVLACQPMVHRGTFVLKILCSIHQRWTNKLPFRTKNGVAQGSVLAPCLYNIYTADFPETSAKRYMYADDVALTVSPQH